MSIVLFALIGQALNANAWYWIVLVIYAIMKVIDVFVRASMDYMGKK